MSTVPVAESTPLAAFRDSDLAATWLQLAAAGAVVALVIAGRGDLTLVAVGLGVSVRRGWQFAASATAVLALAVRWGTTDLGSIGGAVGALGPAVRVGPPLAALACVLAAAALALATLGLPRRARLALAAAVALALVGPVLVTTPGATALGLVVLLVAVAAALLVPPRLPGLPAAGPLAFALALGALASAAAW